MVEMHKICKHTQMYSVLRYKGLSQPTQAPGILINSASCNSHYRHPHILHRVGVCVCS